jgi:hypothetical protein
LNNILYTNIYFYILVENYDKNRLYELLKYFHAVKKS